MLARGVRNVIYNYTDAQRKVRSATSNDAWGPSPALMHEIAELTNNAVAYAEIMPIIWKRLNDHGKNWRHVYKSLVLLDHLIKFGHERVCQQCKENIFAIQTLKDFQYIEDQKDQGYNVREKAKQLVALLKDDERVRNERHKAQEARERYVRQAMGMDSNGAITYGRTASSMRRNSIEGSDPYGGGSYLSSQHAHPYSSSHRSTSYHDSLYSTSTRDFGQPATHEEEQLQMQIAIAESQREAEDEERRRRNDELKLKIALERSVNESSVDAKNTELLDFNSNTQRLDSSLFDNNQMNASHLLATTASNIGWNATNTRPSTHLGFTAAKNDPWAVESNNCNPTRTVTNDPWLDTTMSMSQVNPWNASSHTTGNIQSSVSINASDPWGVGAIQSQSTTISPPANVQAIQSELSDFFGTSANMSTSYNQSQSQNVSSNPWMTATSSINTNSVLPMNTNSSNNSTNVNILYPTIPNSNSASDNSASPIPTSRKTPESFLGGEFTNLVNLDKLVTDSRSTNPFGLNMPRNQNPFSTTTKPTLDQLSSSSNTAFMNDSVLPPPLLPSSNLNNNTSLSSTTFNTNNPFA